VDVVESLREIPFVFCVVDFETAVWQDAEVKWLDWTEICPNDLSGWEQIYEFNCPNSSPSCDIEDTVCSGTNWCQVEFTVKSNVKQGVLKV